MAYTPQNHLYKPATGERGWGALVDTNFDTLDRPELMQIAATALHQAATLGALLDDLYSQLFLLGNTTPFDVTAGGDSVLASGDTVYVRL